MLATSFFMLMALAYSSRGMKVSFPLPHRRLSPVARGVLGAAHLRGPSSLYPNCSLLSPLCSLWIYSFDSSCHLLHQVIRCFLVSVAQHVVSRNLGGMALVMYLSLLFRGRLALVFFKKGNCKLQNTITFKKKGRKHGWKDFQIP